MEENFKYCPIDTPVYLISTYHNLYVGTISRSPLDPKILIRGECIKGDPDSFYREGFCNWAYYSKEEK